jgi:hypothetical protein
MNDLRPALRAFLLADDAIAAVVATRVYPIKIPQGVKATSIVYSRISEQTDHHMQGPSGLVQDRIQIAAWAVKGDDASALALLIKDRLDGFRGQMGADGVFVPVQGIFSESARDEYDAAADLHGVTRDYFIWFAER